MELRRALLLFAIVLGVAAIVTSFARAPVEDEGTAGESGGPARTAPTTPAASPSPAPGTTRGLRLNTRGRVEVLAVPAGRAVTVSVTASEPGQVEVPTLGRTASVEPLAPARFELLAREPGFHTIRYTPVGASEPRTIGLLAFGI